MLQDMAELPPIDQHLEKEHQEKTKVKNIQCVEMGKYEVSSTVLLCPTGLAAVPVARNVAWNMDTSCLVRCTLLSAVTPSVGN